MSHYRLHGRLLLLSAVILLAQTSTTAALAQSASPLLLDLSGSLASIRYSPGSLDRASRVQDHVEKMVEDFDSWSKEKISLGIYLLSFEDWVQIGLQDTYGMPSPMGGRGLALPAWGNPETVALWKGLMQSRLPTIPDPSISISRGTPDELASLLVADVIAIAELARIQLVSAGFRGDKPWVDDVVAHTMALSGILLHKDQRLPEVRMIYNSLSAAGGGSKAHSLAESESPTSIQTKLWFDAQCFTAASIVAESGGKQPAKQILRLAKKNGGVIRASDLVSSFPGLDGWLRSSFSDE